MKRKFLEDLGIEKETIDKILDEAGSDLEKAKGDYETIKKEKETLESQIKERDKQLEELKKNTKTVDDLNKTIEKLQEENKTSKENYAKEIKSIKIDNAIDIALTNAKAKNKQAVRALLKDLDKAEILEDGTIKGLSDQIKTLTEAEDSSFLFEKTTAPSITGATPANSSDGQISGKSNLDPKQMTYSQMMKQLADNPNAKF